jgi:hypothetical protein
VCGFTFSIDLSPDKLQELCAVLDEFALPRAIVDFEQELILAWNPTFLEHTGFSEDEVKSSKPEELLTFGDSWSPLPGEQREGQRVEYTVCFAKRTSGAEPAPGFVVRSHSNIGYVMLDVFGSSSVHFEQGLKAGREEERDRVMRAFHEEVSSPMIAALFLIQTAKIELEDAALPQAEAVSKASDILTQATEKIVEVLVAAEPSKG